jgi:hypothetical protein
MWRSNSVRLNQLLTEEENSLRSLKLPIPKPTAHPWRHSRPDLPYGFAIPPHIAFRVPTPTRSTPQAVYIIVGDSRTLASAEREYVEAGLSVVAFKYPGLWLNRDPYEMYKRIEEQGIDSISPDAPPPLCLIPAFSPGQIQRLEWQANLWSAATGELVSQMPAHAGLPVLHQPELLLPLQSSNEQLVTLKVLPRQANCAISADSFLDQIRTASRPLAFELVRESSSAYFQLSFASQDRTLIEGQFKSHFQKFFIQPVDVPQVFSSTVKSYYVVQAWLPTISDTIKPLADFPLSPYNKLFTFLQDAAPNTQFGLQVMFAPIAAATLKTLHTALDGYQKQLAAYSDRLVSEHEVFTENLRNYRPEYFQSQATYRTKIDDLKGQAQQLKRTNREVIKSVTAYSDHISQGIRKLSNKYPPWLVSVRLICSDQKLLLRLRDHFFHQYETNNGHWQISNMEVTGKLDRRISHWGVHATNELSALVHFPASHTGIVETVSAKQSEPPPLYTQAGIVLGLSQTSGRTQTVTLPEPVRDRHVYVIGRTRSGKSTLLFNMILQDILRGVGVGVIDPHGDLVQKLLDYIPEERLQDTIYLNPTDEQYPVPLNILNVATPENIGVLADDLLITFKRLSETWGERMDSLLRSVVYTLLRTPGATFFDIQRILRDPDYRQAVTRDLDFAPLREFWELDFPQMPKDASQPILHRMSKFALFPTLQVMLSQPTSPLNFDQVMQERKILLVNLSQGELGEDNSKLIGCLLVSQLQLAAMRRARLAREQRQPFYLYIDEFQNFTSSAFEKILSEAGKYMLMLTVCHQYISQLDDQTKDAILGNVGTIVVLPVNEKDATQLRHSLGSYELPDILNLDAAKHEALCRPATKASDTFHFATLAPPPQPEQSFVERIIEHTRSSYSHTPDSSLSEPTETAAQPQVEAKPAASILKLERPVAAMPKQFRTTQDRVLYYLNVAEYLSTRQIIMLCYSQLSRASQKAAASRDLKQLVEAKKVKAQFVGKEKIFFVGKSCSPTTHNLAVRELFTKIERSGFEIAKVDFCRKLGGLTPDLAVDFVLPDGRQQTVFWEYDAGTEGIAELESKIGRYARTRPGARARVFVYDAPGRRAQAMRALPQASCVHAVLDEFESLSDSAFHFAPGLIAPLFS